MLEPEVNIFAKLKEGVEAVMERNPGTKPKSRSSKAAIIDYIAQYTSDTPMPD